ncbi:hypothetical protein [Dyadobacter psychrotolerans]|jgi:hypothetical protein|uniref:Uncharacterized protein n=1 Tax=Dyadobacter psychrotolerans TaxID=2541721 RepID=A0A4R5DBK0_9BACT|nr:hypothetical protein [Dyadobacter psychrotolerans]TDE09370.1 hypothetical protein E0F88_30580 [Dyadobacter psychrotolerans]
MEKHTNLAAERHRLALRFNLSESAIEPEIVPLMLAVEKSVDKIEQAAAKVNETIKPVTYNNHYGHNASAWTIWWGNLSTGIGQNIVAVSLIFSAFLLCCLAAFMIKDAMTDQEKIELAEKRWNYINRQFVRGENGNFYIPKEKYQVTPDKKGIRLTDKEF